MSDLMQFESPTSSSGEPSTIQIYSPGSNPFDDVSRKANHFQLIEQIEFLNESLGILHNSFLDFGRESDTGIRRESLIFRPSLGDNIDGFISPRDSLGLPEIRLFTNNLNESSYNKTNSDLNMGFLLAPSRIMSFNSESLLGSEPSKIFSISSNSASTNQFLDELRSCNGNFRNGVASRIKSLPAVLEENPTTPTNLDDFIMNKAFWSENVKTLSSQLDDSVFITEPQCPNDQSILDRSFDERDLLSNTPQPEELLEVLEELDQEIIKFDCDTVFKEVDKKMPQSTPQNGKSDSSSLNSSSATSNSSRVNATEMLHNLSAIFNTENPTTHQLNEGQNLITSLANLMNQSRLSLCHSDPVDDSGHSSFENIEMEAANWQKCEVLDLRVKTADDGSDHCDQIGVLDLSVKSRKDFTSPKIIPKRFERSTSLNSTKERNNSVSSNESGKLTFKPKKTSVDDKKGPLKAVLPVDTMTRRKSLVSGGKNLRVSKIGEGVSSIYKNKKTSTPIKEPTLKPMAQSTPEGGTVNNGRGVDAPLVGGRLSSATTKKVKLNYSSEKPKLERRRSNSDLKKPRLPSHIGGLNRSYSHGGSDAVISASLNRVRESLKSGNVSRNSLGDGSKIIFQKKGVLADNQNRGSLAAKVSSTFVRKFGNGKENVTQ